MAIDYYCFMSSTLIAFIYHVYLFVRLRSNPNYTTHAVSDRARLSWVKNIMDNPGHAVLAVQTLRNSTMAASFLASTSILLVFGLLNISLRKGTLDVILVDAMNLGKLFTPDGVFSDNYSLTGLKMLLLLVTFFWSFFCFSLSIRNYNHVGYLINANDPNIVSTGYVAKLLNSAGDYYFLGMRGYYLSVPFVFWLSGPWLMIIATIGLVIILHRIDHPPSENN
ncbi:MAG: DUF599 domain-containing protein [Magnetococcales bacterium]|nr:DUF599 domain-containing protein [Magnetococcales bacterium]